MGEELKKVLIVDDEVDFLIIMNERIKSWGFEVIKAARGSEALDLIKQEHPDIVVLDYKMPDMDGIQTLREIRRLNKKIPVIMFTAYPEKSVTKETEGLGVSAFIPKSGVFGSGEMSLKVALSVIEKGLKQ